VKSLAARLQSRWTTAAAFAATAHAAEDRPALFLAGIARGVPFVGGGFYARLGRLLGAEVSPRVRAAGGSRIGLDLRDAGDLMVFEEIFVDLVYPLNLVPFVPDTIVDCGACAGFFTLLAHARFPDARMHAFEPEPKNLERLRRNFALNGLAAEVHAAAVGLADGTASFSGAGFGGHLGAAVQGAIEVRVAGLPQFLRSCGTQKLLLKMDIEGAEAQLLPAIVPLLPRTTALFLETHHPEEECRRYLQPLLDAGAIHSEIRRRHDAAAQTDYVERLLLRT